MSQQEQQELPLYACKLAQQAVILLCLNYSPQESKANFNLIDNNGSIAYKYAEDSGNAEAAEYSLGAHNLSHDGA